MTTHFHTCLINTWKKIITFYFHSHSWIKHFTQTKQRIIRNCKRVMMNIHRRLGHQRLFDPPSPSSSSILKEREEPRRWCELGDWTVAHSREADMPCRGGCVMGHHTRHIIIISSVLRSSARYPRIGRAGVPVEEEHSRSAPTPRR